MPSFFCLLITNNPLKLIIVAPITMFVEGISFNTKYPKIIPNTITEYLADAVSDSGEIMGKKAVMGALTLYLDFINLFIMLLRLFGQRR